MLKKLALVAVAAGALAAVRKRAGGKAEADLWHEATRGPQARQHPDRPLSRPDSTAPPGDVAQLAEHRLCKAGVRGSIPLVSTHSLVASAGLRSPARVGDP